MARRDTFGMTAVRTDGPILPPSLLKRVIDFAPSLGGLTDEDFELSGTKVREAASQAWNALQSPWANFKSERSKLSQGDTGTAITRRTWLNQILKQLDYGSLDPLREALKVGDLEFAVSHRFNHVPIHLVGFGVDLDRKTPGVQGAARRSPHGLVQQLLNSADEYLWGFVSNGLKWRVLRDDQTLSRLSMVEFDLESIFEGQLYDEFLLFYLVCHVTRVKGDRPTDCWLEKWHQAADEEGKRALKTLNSGVRQAIEALGQGFLTHPSNHDLRERFRSGDLSRQEFYRQLLREVYRLLFLFVAEDRGALLDPHAPPEAKALYMDAFSTTRLRRMAEKIPGSDRHSDVYEQLKLVLGKLGSDEGCPVLALPALGSFLFSDSTAIDLDEAYISNWALLTAVRRLATTVEGGRRTRVDYRNMGTEELGSVYESLLELQPDLDIEAQRFELRVVGGNERKTSGSYYTPDSLVQCLLDSALEPVVDAAVRRGGPEEILKLRVIDPAVGSGHFLISAAHRLAKRLALLRAGADEPSPEQSRHALRQVIGHCLYGIDVNPMAAELCKVALWMESVEPGKALGFLDHHIVVGNSLLGTTPDLIANGIPDEAFDPIEGDDKEFCRELKRINKQEKAGQASLFHPSAFAGKELAKAWAAVDSVLDETIEGVRSKERTYHTAFEMVDHRRRMADAWCAAFVLPKKHGEPAITSMTLRRMANGGDLPPLEGAAVEDARDHFGFFHPHLSFPDVFESGGFDVVLGNPPWGKIKLQEKEYFNGIDANVVSASSAAVRRDRIANLALSNPDVHRQYLHDKRTADASSHFFRDSGRFPLTGGGDVDTYSLFAELMASVANPLGQVGVILPTGILTDDGNKTFASHLVKHSRIMSAYDFSNKQRIFESVEENKRFCLLTLGTNANETIRCASQLSSVADLGDLDRIYALTVSDIRNFNPNTLTFPMLLTSRDARIISAMYSSSPAICIDSLGRENSWHIDFERMVDMTNASEAFLTLEQLDELDVRFESGLGFCTRTESGESSCTDTADYMPLYESKFVGQFDHRANSFEGIAAEDRFKTHAGTKTTTNHEHSDPNYAVFPRYWLQREVADGLVSCRTHFLGFRNAISAVADQRSLVAAIVPPVPVGNSLPLLEVDADPAELLFLLSNLNSFATDYVLRQKASGGNLNFFIFKQLPVIGRRVGQETCGWEQSQCTAIWCAARAVELTYTSHDLESFAQRLGLGGKPFIWDEGRRFWLRAELDAAFFHLYGIARDDVDYIMGTFPIVKRKDIERHGSYRTKEAILSIFDEMAEAIRTGGPYQTRLDPPPANGWTPPPLDEQSSAASGNAATASHLANAQASKMANLFDEAPPTLCEGDDV